jgi:hypothetical protein
VLGVGQDCGVERVEGNASGVGPVVDGGTDRKRIVAVTLSR